MASESPGIVPDFAYNVNRDGYLERRGTMCYKKNFCQFLAVLHFVSIALNSQFNSATAKENHGPGDNRAAVSRCVGRLSAAVQKAYADAGLSQEDVAALFKEMRQAGPPPELIGKWKTYEKVRNKLRPLHQPAIEELAKLGPGAVGILLRTESRTLSLARLGDVFVEAVVRMGSPAVPTLVDELSSAEVMPRLHAATALGRIGDPAAVGALIRSLSDPDKRVITAAVSSLGSLKDKQAAEPLLELWYKEETIDRPLIASALGQMGDKRAAKPIRDALEALVREGEKGNWGNGWAISVYAQALGSLRDQEAIPTLKKMLQAPPQKTKTGELKYLIAGVAFDALRQLGVKVEGDKGDYRIIEIAPQETAPRPGEIEAGRPDAPKVIHVDANAQGANDGSSWGDAYKHLQDALAAARTGDEIRAAGFGLSCTVGCGTEGNEAAEHTVEVDLSFRGLTSDLYNIEVRDSNSLELLNSYTKHPVNGEITIKERNKGKLLFRVDSLRALENAICRALMVKYTGSIEQLHEFANIFTLKGQIELALYEHEKIIERFPHDLSITPGCYIGKAMLYMRAGLYDQAFAACDELAAAYAGDNNFHAEMPMSFWSTIAAHGARGEIHEYRKDWELAVQEYKKQLAFVRGSLRTETGDWAKAEKIVQLDEIISERIKSLEKKTEKPK